MSPELPSLEDLLPDDVPEDELAALRRADALLRTTPAPPEEIPESLTVAVRRSGRRDRSTPQSRRGNVVALRRRRFAMIGLAAALAAVAFLAGYFVRGGGDGGRGEAVDAVTLAATQNGPPESQMVVEVLAQDVAGNWPLLGQVTGLDPAAEGEFYELWLTKDKKVVLSCGRFTVDAEGNAEDVWLNAPYKWRDYDDWVVTLERPGRKPPRSKWLLRAPIESETT